MNKLKVDSHGRVVAWFCDKSKHYNDILTFFCGQPISRYDYGACCSHRDFDLGLVASWTLIERSGETHYMTLSEEKQKELHAEFFNKGLSLGVAAATIPELDLKLDELSRIAYEAKCLVQGVAEAKRQRVARLSKEERDKLITKPDLTTSDAFQSVKKRADRMSAADKLVQTYRNLGMEDDEIQKMLGNVKIKESQQSVASSTSKPIERLVERSTKETPDEVIPSNGTAKLLMKEPEITVETIVEVALVEAKQELAEITESKPEVPDFLKGLFGNK